MARALTPTVALLASLLALVATSAPTPVPDFATVVTHVIFPTTWTGDYYAGQEVRLQLKAQTPSINSLLNATQGGFRVRIAAAYNGRGLVAAGAISCTDAAISDNVWYETQDLSVTTTQLDAEGEADQMSSQIVKEGLMSFIVPPFAWQICYLPLENRRGLTSGVSTRTWTQVGGIKGFQDADIFYYPSNVSNAGDYAAIPIVAKTGFPYATTVGATSTPKEGDSVKLVPAGYPCSYERPMGRGGATTADFCGTAQMGAGGAWTHARCLEEGAPANGVATMGTVAQNPLMTAFGATQAITGTPPLDILAAYIQLPAAGNYDVCYSPFAYRSQQQALGYAISSPGWFKIRQGNTTCGDDYTTTTYNAASCPALGNRFVVEGAGTKAPTWALTDVPTVGSWGVIRVEAHASNWGSYLSSNVGTIATDFDAGGDVLRLVPTSDFAAVAGSTAADLAPNVYGELPYEVTTYNETFGDTKTVIRKFTEPSLGSTAAHLGCWATAADVVDVTLFTDLGADIHRARDSYSYNEDFQSEVNAYVPFQANDYLVCYKGSGTQNWRVLQWDVNSPMTPTASDYPSTMLSAKTFHYLHNENYTYYVNHTNAGAEVEFLVTYHGVSPTLSMETSNIIGSISDSATRGSELKLIHFGQRCDTGRQVLDYSTNAGPPECDVSQCSGAPCTGCGGSADESSAPVNTIVHHLLIPNTTEITQLQLCFRNKAGNWWLLRNPRSITGTPEVLFPGLQPNWFMTIGDRTAGSWAKLWIQRYDAGPVDIRAHTFNHGGIFHWVETTQNCEVTFASVSDALGYYGKETQFITDFGIDCLQTTNDGLCNGHLAHPRSRGLNGTSPYASINMGAEGVIAGWSTRAVGFVQMPSTPGDYKGCYKEHASDPWFVFPKYFNVTEGHGFSLDGSVGVTTFVAGSYKSIIINTAAAAPNANIMLETASVKLVQANISNCEDNAAGTESWGGLYESNTLATSRGARFTSATDATQVDGNVTSAKAWMTMPNFQWDSSIAYKVCFRTDQNTANNWINLGEITVRSYGIAYDLSNQPHKHGTMTVGLQSLQSTSMNTRSSGGDWFKIVNTSSPCAAVNEMPPDVVSFHEGKEADLYGMIGDAAALTNGMQDIMSGDHAQIRWAHQQTTLGAAADYRICYRLSSIGVWMDIPQTYIPGRTYNASLQGLFTFDSGVDTLTMSTNLFGQLPATDFTYQTDHAYTEVVPTGASSAFDSASLSGGTSWTYHVTVQGTNLNPTLDEFRVVVATTETSTGTWTAPTAHTCDSFAPAVSVSPAAGSTSTNANLYFNFPSTPGRMILCYKKSGTRTVWIQVEPVDAASKNPVYVVSTQTYLRVDTSTTATLEIVDALVQMNEAHSSLATGDKFYLATEGTGMCGNAISHTATSNTLPGAATALTGGDQAKRTVSSFAGWPYPFTANQNVFGCYYKSYDAQTISSATTKPFARAGNWYRIPVYLVAKAVYTDPWYSSLGVTQVVADCPVVLNNVTTNRPFRLKVRLLDAGGNLVPSTSVTPDLVTANAVSGPWSFENYRGQCAQSNAVTYGLSASNAQMYTHDGWVEYSISAMSRCGTSLTGTCGLSFTHGALTSTPCNYQLAHGVTSGLDLPNNESTVYCDVGVGCTTEVAAMRADGSIQYGLTDTATINLAAVSGVSYTLGGSSYAGGTTNIAITNGKISVVLVPSVSSASSWSDSVAEYSEVVTVAFGSFSVTYTVIITRPGLHTVSIDSLYPVQWDGSVLNDDYSNRFPRWEPSTTFATPVNDTNNNTAFFVPNSPQSILSSVPHTPLSASLYYSMTVTARDGRGNVVTDMTMLSTTGKTLTLVFGSSGTAVQGSNIIVGAPSSASEAHSYATAFPATAFTSATQTFIFRLKNNDGCVPSSTGCSINIYWGNVALPSPSYLQVPVYSPAAKFALTCRLASSSSGYTTTCPPTSVETGVTIRLEAQDPWGTMDTFFEGKIFARLESGDGVNTPTVTQTPQLTHDTTRSDTWTPVTAVDGEIILENVTLSRPCTGCRIVFYSDWNVDAVTVDLVVNPSSDSLQCGLNTKNHDFFLLKADASGIAKKYDPVTDSADIGNLAVYTDTDLCFEVAAANAVGNVTGYETLWIHWHIVSARVSNPVTATAAAQTPYRYRFMQHSRVTFCLNVDGNIGASFSVQFQAQQFGANHWSTTNGICTTSTFTLSNKFVGNLEIGSVNGGLAQMNHADFQLPGNKVWLYKQANSNAEQASISVNFNGIDHYGKKVTVDNINALHANMYVTIGQCTEQDLSQSSCGAGTGANLVNSITVNPTFSAEDGGVLRVEKGAHSHKITNPSFSLTIKQWCLLCDIPFQVMLGNSPYIDSVNGYAIATVKASIVMANATARHVAFPKGYSPWKPATESDTGYATTSHWLHHQPHATAVSTITTPTLFAQDCLDWTTSACVPQEKYFLRSLSMDDNPDILVGPNGEDLELMVLSSDASPWRGEGNCTNTDCYSVPLSVRSQVDILNSYTISVSVGSTQRLKCMPAATATCTGDQTPTISVTIPALGTTIESALLALYSAGAFPTAKFLLAGMDHSSWLVTDPVTGTLPSPNAPSLNGVFTASAVHVPANSYSSTTTLSASTLTSVSALGANEMNYRLAWRGFTTVASVGIRATASDTAFPPTATHAFVEDQVTTGHVYANMTTLYNISFDYAAQPIPFGAALPYTIEALDGDGKRVPVSGTVSVFRDTWEGCNNGGTISATGTTMANGRATLFVTFSAPCQGCYLYFDVTPSATDATQAFYGLAINDQARLIRSKKIEVRGPHEADAVYVTSDASAMAASVTVDTVMTMNFGAYQRVGNYGLLVPTEAVSVSAYNTFITPFAGQLQGGDGGYLRSSNTVVNGAGHHAVVQAATGSGAITFSFQRTCAKCAVAIYWKITSSGLSGAGTLDAADNQPFVTVTAPNVFYTPLGIARQVLEINVATPLAFTYGSNSSNLAFCGYTGATPAATNTITRSVVNASLGDGGVFTVVAQEEKGLSAIFHLNNTKPCYHCRLDIVPVLAFDIILRTKATHYRIERLDKTRVAMDEIISMSAYASDDEGRVDITVGGLTRCSFVRPFFCGTNFLALNLKASGDGLTEYSFFPQGVWMSKGGPIQSTGSISTTFAMTTVGAFVVSNGQTQGDIQFKVTGTPVIHAYPLISDANGLSSAGYPAPGFSVDIGTDNLVLAVDHEGEGRFQVYEDFEVNFGFVNLTDGYAKTKYIAVQAENTVAITFANECPLEMLSPYYISMVNGLATLKLRFTKASASIVGCKVTATSISGNIPCAGDNCTVTTTLLGIQTIATEWQFARPMEIDNNIWWGFKGPLYAVPDRKQVIAAQLWDNTSSVPIRAQSCSAAGCWLEVRPRDACSPFPTVSPSGGALFNENGTATLTVEWKTFYDTANNDTITPYNCELLTRLIGGAIDGPALTNYMVDVCNPTQVVLFNNGTQNPDVKSGFVTTAQSYGFEIMSQNASGAICIGDSQFSVSTRTTISVVWANGTAINDRHIMDVLNVNMTTNNFEFAGNLDTWSRDAYLAAGAFNFQAVFTNYTNESVRIKFDAVSSAPSFTSTFYSAPMRVDIAPARLRISTPFPAYVSRSKTYIFEVQLVDATPESYLVSHMMEPNVVALDNVTLEMHFRPFYRVIPLNFSDGDVTSEITAGRRRFAIQFTGDDGSYSFYFKAPGTTFTQTQTVNVILQTPAAVSIESVVFRTGSNHRSTTNATLPNTAFTQHVMPSVAAGYVLNTTEASRFIMTLLVVDANNLPVVAGLESASISCDIVKGVTSTTTATLANSPALVTAVPLSQALVNGRTNFSVGFTGSTYSAASAAHDRMYIKCDLVTSGLVVTPATTLPIEVQGWPVSSAMNAVLDDFPVIRIPTNQPDAGAFDMAAFRTILRDALNAAGIDYVTSENQQAALPIIGCNVDRDYFGFADLRHSVCLAGVSCTSADPSGCPPAVLGCTCPNAATQTVFRRQQNNNQLDSRGMRQQMMGVDVQLELMVNLRACPGFPLTSAQAIKNEHGKVTDALIKELTQGTALASFGVKKDTIIATSYLAQSATAPATPTPTTSAPTTPVPTPKGGGAAGLPAFPVSMIMVLVASILFALPQNGEMDHQ